ncbi:hypothetical protein [Halomonas lysinitropha]|uniref:Uncharacterized protein n=1 Tax=Halomonas lysinitropha TaxID=2607506 RepID=A0A5K1I2Z9_9GAMM|nr:hypothetical protein [Halomonas lysinitropha]VVZ94538.1 hypothetical protein HALO32_00591 [Halomonas lysinitropha]
MNCGWAEVVTTPSGLAVTLRVPAGVGGSAWPWSVPTPQLI